MKSSMDHDANWENIVFMVSEKINVGLIVRTPTWYLCNKYHTNYNSYCHVFHNFPQQNLSSLYCITGTSISMHHAVCCGLH